MMKLQKILWPERDQKVQTAVQNYKKETKALVADWKSAAWWWEVTGGIL